MTKRCLALLLALLVGLTGAGAGHAQGLNPSNLARVQLQDGIVFQRESGGVWRTLNAPAGSPVLGMTWTDGGYGDRSVHLNPQGGERVMMGFEWFGEPFPVAAFIREVIAGEQNEVIQLAPVVQTLSDYEVVVSSGAHMPYEDCGTLSGRVSPPSTQPATVTFDNRSGGLRQVAWVGFDGGQTLFMALPPHTVQTQETFVGHVWAVIDPVSDRCLEVRVAQPGARFNLIAPGR